MKMIWAAEKNNIDANDFEMIQTYRELVFSKNKRYEDIVVNWSSLQHGPIAFAKTQCIVSSFWQCKKGPDTARTNPPYSTLLLHRLPHHCSGFCFALGSGLTFSDCFCPGLGNNASFRLASHGNLKTGATSWLLPGNGRAWPFKPKAVLPDSQKWSILFSNTEQLKHWHTNFASNMRSSIDMSHHWCLRIAAVRMDAFILQKTWFSIGEWRFIDDQNPPINIPPDDVIMSRFKL